MNDKLLTYSFQIFVTSCLSLVPFVFASSVSGWAARIRT